MREIRCPERDGAVLVPEVDDSVVRVLAHRMTCTQLRSMLDYELAGGCVLVLQKSGIALCAYKHVSREK